MIEYFRKRREQRNKEIAREVINQLGSYGWKKFLPPVAMRDKLYFLTEDGTLYALRYSSVDDMEVLSKIMEIR